MYVSIYIYTCSPFKLQYHLRGIPHSQGQPPRPAGSGLIKGAVPMTLQQRLQLRHQDGFLTLLAVGWIIRWEKNGFRWLNDGWMMILVRWPSGNLTWNSHMFCSGEFIYKCSMFASYVSLPEGNVSKAKVNYPYFDGLYHADNGKCGMMRLLFYQHSDCVTIYIYMYIKVWIKVILNMFIIYIHLYIYILLYILYYIYIYIYYIYIILYIYIGHGHSLIT